MSNWVPKSAKPDGAEIGSYLGNVFGQPLEACHSLSRNTSSGWAQRRHKAISVNKATAAA